MSSRPGGPAPERRVIEWPRWILGPDLLKLLQSRKTSCCSLLSIKSCLRICVHTHAHVYTHGSTGPGAQRAVRRAGTKPDACWGVGSRSWATAHQPFLEGLGPGPRQSECLHIDGCWGAKEMAWKMSLLGICSSSFIGVVPGVGRWLCLLVLLVGGQGVLEPALALRALWAML